MGGHVLRARIAMHEGVARRRRRTRPAPRPARPSEVSCVSACPQQSSPSQVAFTHTGAAAVDNQSRGIGHRESPSSLARRAAAALRRPWVAPALLLAVAVVVGVAAFVYVNNVNDDVDRKEEAARVLSQMQTSTARLGNLAALGSEPSLILQAAADAFALQVTLGQQLRRWDRVWDKPTPPAVAQLRRAQAELTRRLRQALRGNARAGRASPAELAQGNRLYHRIDALHAPGGRRRRGRQQRRRHQDRGRDGRRDRVRGGDARAGPARARAPAPDAARRRDERGGARGDARERGAIPLRDRPRAGPDLHDRRRRAVRLHERAHRRVSRRPGRRRCRPVARPPPPGRHAARAVDVVERHARGGAGRGRVPHAGRGR